MIVIAEQNAYSSYSSRGKLIEIKGVGEKLRNNSFKSYAISLKTYSRIPLLREEGIDFNTLIEQMETKLNKQ